MPNPPKPNKTKVIQGTFRKYRAPKNEPDPAPVLTLPNPPTVMPKHGKRLWKKLGLELLDKGLLTVVDLPAFEMCCFTYGLYREAAEVVFKHITDPNTGRRRRQTFEEYMAGRNSQTMPEYTSLKQAFTAYRGFLSEFGLSPGTRSRIDLPERESDEGDPIERMWNES